MTVMFHLWRKAAAERNALQREVIDLRHEVAVARAQHVQDGRRIDDLEHHLELMACDNADLERANAALTDGLRWFDPKASK